MEHLTTQIYPAKTFKICVKNPYALQYVYETVAVSGTTIGDIKREISLKHEGPPDLKEIVLLYLGKKLSDEITLYKLSDNSWTSDCVSFHLVTFMTSYLVF